MSKARSMTKNHYYRDDPAFVVVQVFFLVMVDLSWGITTRHSFASIVWITFGDFLVNYVFPSLVLTTVTWILVNRFLMGKGNEGIGALADGRREVEWQYSFDVHCNAYFTFFMWTRVVLLIALPLLLNGDGFFSRLIGDGILLLGAVAYVYNVFLGYLDLPMLVQQQRLMYPIPFLVLSYVILVLFTNLNVLLDHYVGFWGHVSTSSHNERIWGR